MKKKILSLFLCLTLFLTLMPTIVFAADYSNDPIVSIAGVEMMDLTDVTYFLNDGEGGLTTEGASADNYNLMYEPIQDGKCTITFNGVDLYKVCETTVGTNWPTAGGVYQPFWAICYFNKVDTEIILMGDNKLYPDPDGLDPDIVNLCLGHRPGESGYVNTHNEYYIDHRCIFERLGSLTFSGDGNLDATSADYIYNEWCDTAALDISNASDTGKELVFNGTGRLSFTAGHGTISSFGIYAYKTPVEVNSGEIIAKSNGCTSGVRSQKNNGNWFSCASAGIYLHKDALPYIQNGGVVFAESGDAVATVGSPTYSYGMQASGQIKVNDGTLITRCGDSYLAEGAYPTDVNGVKYGTYYGACYSYLGTTGYTNDLSVMDNPHPAVFADNYDYVEFEDLPGDSSGVYDAATALDASRAGNIHRFTNPKAESSADTDLYDEEYYDECLCYFTHFFMISPVVVLKYDFNGGEGAEGVDYSDYEYAISQSAVTKEEAVRENWVFVGWNTEQDGSGDMYREAEELVMPDHDVTLYAQWEEPVSTYSVKYVVNGDKTYGQPKDSVVPVDSTAYNYEDTVKVADALSTTYKYAIADGKEVKGTWKFSGWDKGDFKITEDTVITGSWQFIADSPKTGDNNSMFLWIAIMLISVSAFAGTAVYSKKRK